MRFPGQYADDETGLHYNYQRYYDPVTGGYLSPDPLGLAPAPNPHAYVPNPTVLTDPLGLSPYNLSDPNPVPRAVNNEYEKIQAMRAAQRTGVPSPLGDPTPRWDYNQLQQGNYVQETYQATGLGPINAAQWRGSLIWDVPGTPYRILERPDGRFGYVSDHNYNAPKLFPAPWYPDGGKP